MVTLKTKNLGITADTNSSELSTAEILIKQRESLMERLKNIRPEELSIPDLNAPLGKSFWDSVHWNSNWSSNWDSGWNSNVYSHEKVKQEDDEDSVSPSLGQD